MEERIDHGDVEMGSAASTFTMKQRMTNRPKGMHASVGVSHAKANEGWRTVSLTSHVHDPCRRLRYEIEAWLTRERAGLTEARN